MCANMLFAGYVLLRPKVPKVALIAMQRPTPRCTRLAIRLIVLARLRTSADTTACCRSRPLTRPQIVIWGCSAPQAPWKYLYWLCCQTYILIIKGLSFFGISLFYLHLC